MGNFFNPSHPSFNPTRRLTLLYISALSAVALLAIVGQIAIQFAIQQQAGSALVMNVAGRQRMLSQKISKAALIIEFTSDPTGRVAHVQELEQAGDLWKRAHDGLFHGDEPLGLPGNKSEEVTRLLGVIEPNYQAMVIALQGILVTAKQTPQQSGQLLS